ncbi:MAG: S8 family peptidase [Myxococcaceae bacterium]
MKLLSNFALFLLLGSSSAIAAPAVKPGSLLVKRKLNAGITTLSTVHAKAHTTSLRRFNYPAGLELVQVQSGTTDEQALAVYRTDPNIEYAEPNYIVHALDLPNDTYFKYQWGLNNVGQTGGTVDTDINAPEAWSILSGSDSVVLGTIDTGFDYTHPDLTNNIWTNSQEIPGNGIDDDGNGYIDDVHGINAITGTGDPMDDNMHGTHVAGIIGAQGNNGLGVSGVMQKTKIIACKFLDAQGSGDTGSAITCMNYYAALAQRSTDPVKVVATNNSWGGGLESQAFTDAVAAHQKLGILFMAAASNETNNNDVNPTFPSDIALSNVISVAATDFKDNLASFSNYGRHSVHVAAPGVDILSTIPGAQYNYLSGTSMATPFVTGLAGYIKASDPTLDWVSIKNLIIAGGQPIAAAAQTTISGRRIRMIDTNGQGSVSCSNQTVVGRLLPKGNAYTIKLGQSIKLSLLKINCAKSTQVRISSTNVNIKAGLLNDLGQGADDVAYDGVFNGYYKPTAVGRYTLAFPNGDNVSLTVKQ